MINISKFTILGICLNFLIVNSIFGQAERELNPPDYIKTISFKTSNENYSTNLPIIKLGETFTLDFDVLNNEEADDEPVDLQIYRIAERKAKKIGVITRLLKENAVDCLLNSAQTNVSEEKINKTIKQRVSSKKEIDFHLGDKKYSPICDLMDCNYKCNGVI